MLCAALLRSFRGQHSEKMKGSAWGNWGSREGQQPFRPNPNGAGDRTTTLRRLLIGAVSPAWSLLRLCGSLYRREFSFCARWAELHIFVNKSCKKASTVSCFSLTKQKGSAVSILPALQSNSAGSVLTNDGTIGAGIRELKPGAAASRCPFWDPITQYY